MRSWPFVQIATIVAALLTSEGLAEAARFNQTLDDGTTVVVVDNFSSYSTAHVGNLVLAADRSTKDDGMWYRATTTGLMDPGDRVYVNDNYMAWLRSSYLLGVWTIGASGYFAHLRTGPEFTNWSHNELAAGSASPSGETWHWDVNSFGVEYTVQIPIGGVKRSFRHDYGFVATNGAPSVLYDGAVNPLAVLDGVTYASSVRLADGQVDVSDFNDSNGIQNYVESQLAYVMRASDIKVIWRVRPASSAITPTLIYYWLWAHYSFDVDGQLCFDPTGNVSPGQTWGTPVAYRSTLASYVGIGALQAANTIYSLSAGVPCDNNANIRYAPNPGDGSSITWGESGTLAAGTPQWTITSKTPDVSLGYGYFPSWFAFGNETNDGVWGGGGFVFN